MFRSQPRSSVAASESRVLVIGLDGATFDVLGPLVDSGVMPNLARLMRTSALAELNSTRPFITPVAWSTFQTGGDPHEHGIWDYRYLDHPRGRLQLNHTGRFRRPTLFDAVSQAGGEVVSLNLPMTFPAPPEVRGIVIGGIDAPSISAAVAPRPEFARKMQATGASFELRTIWKRRPATIEELSAGIDRTVADFHGRAIAARVADSLTDWRLMVVQFQTLDCLQHRCWEWLGVGVRGQGSGIRGRSEVGGQRSEVGNQGDGRSDTAEKQVQRAMRALDCAVGELCELAERKRAAVVVVSDHGFGPFREKINVMELLRRRGLIAPLTVARRGRYVAAHLAWKARRWAAGCIAGGPSTASLFRTPAALAPIDWRRSQAVVLHGDLAGMVYLNSSDRFAAGPLGSHSQREQATAEIMAAFREARHPQTAESLFDEVIDTRRAFDCDPIERQWPEVIAIPAAGFHTRTKLDAPGELLRSDPAMTGTHRPLGVLMINSPRAILGRHTTAQLRDVAPTILRLLDIPPAQPMTGRVLDEMLSLDANSTASPQSAARISADLSVYDEAETAAVESRLRDLGYLD
ncbi:MAG: alkaline phosphatase family protein [Planctomycetes bacterium]|nr:alkaline phosphatase family protein [Planctomycetota bacterium]